MNEKIPMLDLHRQIEELRPEIERSVRQVLQSGRFILGPNVAAFEDECAAYLGVEHAIGLNSGTDALTIGLRALELQPGDEVITSAFTFFATSESITHCGAVPVFVDIEPNSFCIDPEAIRAAIGPRTRAILPVHLFGHAVDMDPLLALAAQHGLAVLEDTAQAFGGTYKGRRLGGLGNAGACSFFPSKNLGAFGDGGLLTTNDASVAERARALRQHGASQRYNHTQVGYNSRLDELQAAILRVKLPHVDRWNEARRELARAYDKQLASVAGFRTPSEACFTRHVYNQYTLRVLGHRRNAVLQQLQDQGIAAAIHYPKGLHQLPGNPGPSRLPQTEQTCGEVLSLPLWPEMPRAMLERVAAAVSAAG